MDILTVSQINFYVKTLIDENANLSDLFITGEISNFKNHYSSGHFYFSLKDEKSVIKCVMFKSCASKVKFELYDGLKVLLRAKLSVYEASGQYQLYVFDIQPSGLGAQVLAFNQLKDKLDKMGVFDEAHKKALPPYPEHIGVITANGSAALEDILKILKRRFPLAEVILFPVTVQGENSAKSLCTAVKYFNKSPSVELIIIARGGGSKEDLSAFNDESLALEIYNSKIPVISGVGHQIDFTICDFVSDLRAPTPSAAAELAVPNKDEILSKLKDMKMRMTLSLNNTVTSYFTTLDIYSDKLRQFSPLSIISSKRSEVDNCFKLLNTLLQKAIYENREKLNLQLTKLKALNPVSLLENGYAVVFDENGKRVKSVNDVENEQTVKIIMNDGYLNCYIKDKEVNN